MVHGQGAINDLLDGLVGQYLAKKEIALARGKRSRPVIAAKSPHRSHRDSQIMGGIDHALGHRVHHARPEQHRGYYEPTRSLGIAPCKSRVDFPDTAVFNQGIE